MPQEDTPRQPVHPKLREIWLHEVLFPQDTHPLILCLTETLSESRWADDPWLGRTCPSCGQLQTWQAVWKRSTVCHCQCGSPSDVRLPWRLALLVAAGGPKRRQESSVKRFCFPSGCHHLAEAGMGAWKGVGLSPKESNLRSASTK